MHAANLGKAACDAATGKAPQAIATVQKIIAGAEIKSDAVHTERKNHQARLLRGLEPFQRRAESVADYLQYRDDAWLMLADLQVMERLRPRTN